MARTSKLETLLAGSEAFKTGQDRARSYLLIGQEMRALREREGLTQLQLSAMTGVDQADISRLEAGKWGSRGISFDVLGRLLPVFGLRIAHQVQETSLRTPSDPRRLASARVITELLVAEA